MGAPRAARRVPRAARHPGYGRTRYWADGGFLRVPRDIPVMGEPAIGWIRGFCACRATSRLWANQVLGGSGVFARAARHSGYGRTRYWADPEFLRAPRACAPRDIPVMGEPGIGRIRGFCARRAPRDIPVMGELGIGRIRGFCARFAPRAARHPGYGRTGYWADQGFLRAPRDFPVMSEPGIGWIRGFCAPHDILVMGEPGIGRIRGFCARRAPRDIPVMGEPGIRRIRVLARAARHPG